MSAHCINYSTCPIINDHGFISDPEKRDIYIKGYCEAGEKSWGSCKRYMMKLQWNLCPDFVLPDSHETTDALLDKFENEQ